MTTNFRYFELTIPKLDCVWFTFVGSICPCRKWGSRIAVLNMVPSWNSLGSQNSTTLLASIIYLEEDILLVDLSFEPWMICGGYFSYT